MLISTNFVWLHLPKTGGTSTAKLFREINIPDIAIDPDDVDMKHESIENRLKSNTVAKHKKIIITTRRLTSWLLSDWHHKTKKWALDFQFNP